MKKILIILLLSFSFSAELDMNQDDCSNLGIENAKEQSYEQIFNSGLIMGFVTAGVFGLPAYAYRNKYLEKYKTHEINFQNIDVEDYENDDLCKQEYIESYNTNYIIDLYNNSILYPTFIYNSEINTWDFTPKHARFLFDYINQNYSFHSKFT